MKQKILLVITRGGTGGAQKFVCTLARGLKECGADVAVAYGDGNFIVEQLKDIEIPLFKLQSLRRTFNPLTVIRSIFEIRRLINVRGFTIVHFNSSNALLTVLGAKLAKQKVKTIFTVHGLSLIDPSYQTVRPIKYFFKHLFRSLFSFIDKVVFVCRSNFEWALQNNIVKKGSVIYNGFDIKNQVFKNTSDSKSFFSKKLGRDLSGTFVIGSIGRLAYPKNYDFLITQFPEILKIMPTSLLLLIGDGPERKKYLRIIQQLGLQEKVFILGEITNAATYLKGFDLLVLPSLYEGLSMVLIEASFAGVPILASNVGGNAEIVNIADGQLFISGNSHDFIEKFKFMTETVPKTSKQVADSFSLEAMINNYLNLYGK